MKVDRKKVLFVGGPGRDGRYFHNVSVQKRKGVSRTGGKSNRRRK